MLNISLPAFTKVELWDLTVCIVVKSSSDLDLGPTMPNIKLVRYIFIYYDVIEFHVPRSITIIMLHYEPQPKHADMVADE